MATGNCQTTTSSISNYYEKTILDSIYKAESSRRARKQPSDSQGDDNGGSKKFFVNENVQNSKMLLTNDI